MGLHHIAIICSSEDSIDFYKRLGFKETFRRTRSYDSVVLMEGQDTRLEIFIDPNHPRRAMDPEALGVRHIAIKVDNMEKARRDFDCGPVLTDWLGEKYCMTADPDGLPIELHE